MLYALMAITIVAREFRSSNLIWQTTVKNGQMDRGEDVGASGSVSGEHYRREVKEEEADSDAAKRNPLMFVEPIN